MGSIIVPESGLRGVKLAAIPVCRQILKTTIRLPLRRTLQIRTTGMLVHSVDLREIEGGGRTAVSFRKFN